jgi:hypothetical protein
VRDASCFVLHPEAALHAHFLIPKPSKAAAGLADGCLPAVEVHLLLMAGLIVVPQVVVALLSPWVGYYSDKWGLPANVSVLVTAQLLGGISAAAVTVLTILLITDLTTGTGRFNLVRGAIGTLIAIAASISTTATGFLFEALGN